METAPDSRRVRRGKVEYLEIEVYRTTPLVLDGGLVGDNRASKSFRVCNFLRRSVQSPRFFLLAVSSPSNGEKSWRTLVPLLFFFSLFSPSSYPTTTTTTWSTSRLLFRHPASFTSALHAVPASIRYTIADTPRFVVARAYRDSHGRGQFAFRWRLRFDV